MRTPNTHLIAAAAALLTLGAAGFAEAKEERANVMSVRTPSGEIVRIRYVGAVPPVVTFAPRAHLSAQDFFARDPLWAETDRMFAAMRRRMALMMREAELMRRASPQQLQAIAEGRPGFCMRSVRITRAPGQAPQIEDRSYGDCAGPSDRGVSTPTRQLAPPQAAPAPVIVRPVEI